MTKARVIIRNALSFHLNRLSPGEQEDADLFGRCLDALNEIADEINGGKSLLWREVLTPSIPLTGNAGTLGTTWPGLSSGDEILGATVAVTGTDQPMDPITLAQYQAIAIKAVPAIPQQYAQDGASAVYVYPAAVGHVITLRTRQPMTEFADLDSDYDMPKGYRAHLSALLAEKMAPTLVGGISPDIAKAARRARQRMAAQSISPEIISAGPCNGRLGEFLAGR